MPSHLERRHNTGNLHYITFSCHDRKPYLNAPSAKSLFLTILESRRIRFAFTVIGYVVMPEHVHLLVTEPPTLPLAQALASIKREASRQLPQSPFWLPRYYDFNIFTNEKRLEKLRYIHRNPICRGLVEKPEDYEWSSFRNYARLDPGPSSHYPRIKPPTCHSLIIENQLRVLQVPAASSSTLGWTTTTSNIGCLQVPTASSSTLGWTTTNPQHRVPQVPAAPSSTLGWTTTNLTGL